ncbi:MAG: hypothetical protein Q8J78_04935 [Moraxellaceae bacterium]|nr:hypothetical protein [Moraxellaceae bacterium]
MSTAEQLAFPFASLDFPGRTTLGLGEIAKRIGCSVDHLLNEVEHGALCGIDLKGAKATLRFIRVPVEAYRAYVLQRMTGEFRRNFIRDLPAHVKRELRREMIGASDKAELREMITEIKGALTA